MILLLFMILNGEPVELTEGLWYGISYVFRDSEIADPKYMLSMSIVRLDGQPVLLSRKDAGGESASQRHRGIKIDPNGSLYREFCEWEQMSAEETEQDAVTGV